MATDVGTLQSKLTLDFSQFASGMNSAISMVRSFGKQLQKALGSTATQGFSTTNRAINDIQTSISNLQAAVASFQATMQNTNTTLAQFSNLQANTSRMGQGLNNAAQSAQRLHAAATNIAPRVNAATFSARNLKQHFSTAGKQATTTAAKVNKVAQSSKKAEQNANKMKNNISAAGKAAESLKRILGGIVVSQAFYKMLSIMQDLVSSSIEFMTNMEQSAIAFKYLLGSAENSMGFLEALQDFAVSSPLDMSGAESAARMLMTMGFEAESTIAVLRTLTDAATVAGGDMSDTTYRIALALGQMLQSGTVKMQELRQLVNANIPIFDILQTELGLTAEQIANIGETSVDSGKAVMAILFGLQKRFGGASLEMQQTVTGAISATKDSFYILFNEVMAGPYEQIRQKLVSLSNAMQYLAQVARQYGAGGVFEAIIPERLQDVIRNVIGAFMQLGKAITFLGRIATEIFGGMGEIILQVLNIILPPITILLNAILQFTYGLLKACPIIKYFFSALMLLAIVKPIGALFLWFWKIIGLGKIIMTVVGYIMTLAKAISALSLFLIHNPILGVITIITVAILTLTGVIQKAINKFKELFSIFGAKLTTSNKTLNEGMGIGYDPSKILQPTDKETNDSAEKYKGSLEEISSKLQDVGDEANKTKNKLKNAFNQSFDEVYTINPNTGDDLGLDSLENLDLTLPLEGLGEFNDLLSDIGDFNLDGWVDDFMVSWQDMWDQIKERIKDYGLAAVIAGLTAGVLTKNPWVGLAAALATLLWPTVADHLGLTEDEGEKVIGGSIGVLLSSIITKIAGKGILAKIGWAGIAALIFAGLWPAIQEYIDSGEWDSSVQKIDFTLFGGGLAAAIGTALGGPLIGTLAGLIGAAIGSGIQGGIDAWAEGKSGWQIADATNWTTTGMGLGTAIGLAIAGPMGAAIGLVIGGLVGFIADQIASVLGEINGDWDVAGEAFKLWGQDIGNAFIDGLLGDGGLFGWTTEIFSWAGDCFKEVGKAFEEQDWLGVGKWILEGILAGLIGAITFIFEPISRVFWAIFNGFCALFGINSPAEEMKPIGEFILKGVLEGIIGFITGIPAYIAKAGKALFDAMASWFVDFGATVSGWFGDGVSAIKTFIVDTASDIGGWVSDRINDFNDFKTQASEKISNWANSVKNSISNWATNTKTSISNWASNAKQTISNWATNTSTSVSNWWSNVKAKFDSFKSISFSSWCDNTFKSLSTWCSNIWSSVKDKVGSAIDKVKEFLGLSSSKSNISVSASVNGLMAGHANGGVFNREHWARFAEGNKAEAIIPLENATAMQPFVDAVSNGLTATLAPILASANNNNNNNNLQPLYVGTLVADERGLKELERKMQIIRVKEERRG